MGKAAEWEIWRRHGVDISDEGWCSNHQRFRGHKPVKHRPQDFERDFTPHPVFHRERQQLQERFTPSTKPLDQLKPKQGTVQMDTKELVNLMQLQNGATLFTATFEDNSKQYAFKDVLGLDLKVGDRVVVESRDTMALVTVTAINVRLSAVQCSLSLLKHAITKVDTSALDALKEREADAEDRLAAAEVYERLEKYQKQLGPRLDDAARLLSGQPAPQPTPAPSEVKPWEGDPYPNG